MIKINTANEGQISHEYHPKVMFSRHDIISVVLQLGMLYLNIIIRNHQNNQNEEYSLF